MYLVVVDIKRCAKFAKWLQTSKFVCVYLEHIFSGGVCQCCLRHASWKKMSAIYIQRNAVLYVVLLEAKLSTKSE